MASVEQAYFRNIIPRYENEEHNNKSKAGKTRDDLHYTKEGYTTFGKRLAEKAIKLVKK